MPTRKHRWDSSKRKARLPVDWYTYIVPFIKKRDNNQCQWRSDGFHICGKLGTDVDHIVAGDDLGIIRNDKGKIIDYKNLRLLCTWHHGKKSSSEGLNKQLGTPVLKEPKPHPGMILP